MSGQWVENFAQEGFRDPAIFAQMKRTPWLDNIRYGGINVGRNAKMAERKWYKRMKRTKRRRRSSGMVLWLGSD